MVMKAVYAVKVMFLMDGNFLMKMFTYLLKKVIKSMCGQLSLEKIKSIQPLLSKILMLILYSIN